MTPGLSFTDRLLLGAVQHPLSERVALRALFKATRLLSLALGHSLREFRESDDPLLKSHAATREQAALCALLSRIIHILGARWDKIPHRQRPHYTPHQRFQILEIKRLLALSADETAGLFRLSTGTILDWEREVRSEPQAQAIGSRIKPVPPVRRYADVVREMTRTLFTLGFGQPGQIAATLARAGWKLSRETVRRILQERTPPPPAPPAAAPRTPLNPRRPHHVRLVDLTEIKALFGLRSFHLAVILDAFSRFPLAARLFDRKPTAADMAAMVRSVHWAWGPTRYVVTDRGGEFTGEKFQRTLRSLAAKRRFSGVGGPISRLDRFFRTLKGSLNLRFLRPLTRGDLERRLGHALAHYSFFRPHQGLGGATPAEALFGWQPQHLAAVPPPRGRPGDTVASPEFHVDSLDSEGQYPILVRVA